MAQGADFQAPGGGEPDRAPFGGQEADHEDEVQERKLVAKVQRDLQPVSFFVI